MDTLLQDLRYSFRQLRRSPGFTVVAVLTIGLGVGATATVFSLVNAVLLRPPTGVQEPKRVLDVWGARDGQTGFVHSYPAYEDFREHATSMGGLAAYGIRPLSVSTGEMAERIFGFAVSQNYFQVLGTRAAAGRLFHPADEQAVVLSHTLWQRRFAGDPAIVGQSILINGQPLTVVGVAERGFAGTLRGFGAEAWVPLPLVPLLTGWTSALVEGANWLHIVGRLHDDVTRQQAAAEMNALAARLAEWEGRDGRSPGVALSRAGAVRGEDRGALLGVNVVFGILSLLVLVIACGNIAGMLLARGASRGREVAVRMAIGAGRRRIIRQLLTESTLLFLLGGAAGLVVAIWAGHLLLTVRLPGDFPLHLDLSPDWRVFAFALMVALGAGVLFGLSPALRGSDLNLTPALKDASPGGARRTSRLRSAHVVAQVAFSLLLLITAGLFLRALQQAHSVDIGFDPHGVLAAGFDLEIQGYSAEQQRVFYEQLLERAAALPGVEQASLARQVPLGFASATITIQVDGERLPNTATNVVGPDYFSTLRIPLRQGRQITAQDGENSPPVVVVNRALAERVWPGGNAVGRQIQWGSRTLEVVGVVENSKHGTLGEAPEPFIYVPVFQQQSRTAGLTLFLRTSGNPAALLPALRREVDTLNPHVPILSPAPLAELITIAMLPYRLGAWFAGVLGMLGLVLACIGLYGVLSFLVAQRTREIGVRMAIGASQSQILRMMLTRGLRLVAIGLGVGVLLALGGTRLLESFLFDVSPTDPLTFGVVILLLLTVAALASYLPARRATRIDPMVALRSE